MTDGKSVIPVSGIQTMSSREIAELCEKRHDHVMRDIRDMIAQLHGENEAPRFGGYYIAENGKQNPCFNLPKRETLILVSGYNLAMRAKIIDRWQELESQQQGRMVALPNDYASALRALADETERSGALAAKVEADAPKVAFAEQVSVAPDAISIGQAAKILGTGRNRLAARLRQMHWITRLNEPYQDKIDAGLLDVKIGSWDHPDKGLQRSVTPLVTGKGLTKLHGIISHEGGATL